MSLRSIATDLYRLLREVERLEKDWANSPPTKRDDLERQILRARRERDQLRRILDGRLDR